MFCGGIFAFCPENDDIFVVADGQEMTQHDLLNICRGSMSILINSPIEQGARKVLFVEAASTYLGQYKNYIFGISTYHQQSIPLLAEFHARLLGLLKVQFPNEINLTNHHARSILFHALKALLGNDITHKATPTTKLLNIPETVALNTAVSFKLSPKMDGDFFVNDQADAQSMDVSSTLDSMASGLYNQNPSISEESETGTVDLAIEEEITFDVANNEIKNSDVEVRISAVVQCKSDLGGLFLKVPPQPPTVNVRPNPQFMQEQNEFYVCATPAKALAESQLVLFIKGENPTPIPPPFHVNTLIQENEEYAKVTVTISSEIEVNSIVIGIEGQGLNADTVSSPNSELSNANGTMFILRPNESIPAGGGQIEASFFGRLDSKFTRPQTVSIQCNLPNYLLGDYKPEMKPGSNFITGVVQKKTFVQKSTWAISE